MQKHNKKQTSNKPLLACTAAFLAVCAVTLFVPSSADAAMLRTGNEYQVEKDVEIQSDLYFAGSSFTLNGTTTGDVYAAGLRDVTVTGTITEDGVFVTPLFTQTGTMQGDLRVAGGQVVVAGDVTEDIVAAGLYVHITKDAVIKGDAFIVATDRIDVYGDIQGNADLRAKTVAIYGTLGDDVRVHANEVFVVHDSATIAGNVDYVAPREMQRSTEATINGTVTFSGKTIENDHVVYDVIFKSVSVLVLALLLLWLLPHTTNAIARSIAERANGFVLLWGVGALLGIPLAAGLLFSTGVGALPAVLVLFLYGVLVVAALGYVPIALGILIAKAAKVDARAYLWQSIVVGSFAWVLVWFVPFVGIFLGILFMVLTFGEIVRAAYWYVRNARKAQ